MKLVRDDMRPSQILTRDGVRERDRRDRRARAARRTACCTCSRSRASSASRSRSRTSTRSRARTPIVADIKPGGRYVATDLHEAGGVALVARELVARALVHGDAPDVDGRTLGQVGRRRARRRPARRSSSRWRRR